MNKTGYWKSTGRASRLVAFFVGLCILQACKDPALGLETQPEGDAVGLLRTDTLTLEAATEREDSVRSDELSLNLLGAMNDPALGKIRASIYMQCRTTSSTIDVGTNPLADSIVLVLPYRNYYGDVTKLNGLQKFKVYRVIQPFYKDSTYYSNDSLAIEPNLLGATGYITPALRDSVPVTGKKEAPQLRIRLNNGLANDILTSGTALSSADNFVAFLNGLYVTAETRDEQAGRGAILDFALTSGARLDVFFHNDANDSLRLSFPVNENSARVNRYHHSYLPSVLNAIGNTQVGETQLFTHTMGGLRTRVRLPFLQQWKANRNLIVHQAKLTVYVSDGSTTTYAPNPQHNLILRSNDGTLLVSPDLAVNNASYSGGTYNSSTQSLEFNITRFIQGRLKGVITLEDFYIQPTSTGVSAYRTLLNGTKAASRPFRLEILYQELP